MTLRRRLRVRLLLLLKNPLKGLSIPGDRVVPLFLRRCVAKRIPLNWLESSSESSPGSTLSRVEALGSSLLFHQATITALANPPAAPSRMLNGTAYFRKKKQNRKNNQTCSPVESPPDRLARFFLRPVLSLFSLITSWQLVVVDRAGEWLTVVLKPVISC